MRALWVVAAVLATVVPAWGHAFPDRSEPRGGPTQAAPPPPVGKWVDGANQPRISTHPREDTDKRRVDKNDARVSPTDGTLLEVGLPPLAPGRYQVFWSVVARDGHRTEGSFAFRIK